MTDLIKEMNEAIKGKRITKYGIAKSLKISWNTVHMWSLGLYKPNEINEPKLRIILKDIENV